MNDIVSMVIKAETEGFDDFEEACEYAQMLIDTGLVNSTGSNGRFVRDMIDAGWEPS